MEHGDRRQIQGIAGVIVKGADAPLAEDDLFIAVGHDVLGTHQQFLQGVGKATLEEDGLAELAQLPQKVEILHIPCAYLQYIHVIKEGQVHHTHDLGDDGQAGLLPGNFQQFQTLGLQTGEIIRRGAGLEGAAPEHIGTGGLHRLGHRHDLFLRFHGAGTGHDAEVSAADLHVADLYHGVLRVEFAVAALKRLSDPLYGIHNVETGYQVHIHLGGIAHQSQNGLVLALGHMDVQPQILEPIHQLFTVFLGNTWLQRNDHNGFLL